MLFKSKFRMKMLVLEVVAAACHTKNPLTLIWYQPVQKNKTWNKWLPSFHVNIELKSVLWEQNSNLLDATFVMGGSETAPRFYNQQDWYATYRMKLKLVLCLQPASEKADWFYCPVRYWTSWRFISINVTCFDVLRNDVVVIFLNIPNSTEHILENFFVIKPTRCTNFTNLFCHETLQVSDSSSVHH